MPSEKSRYLKENRGPNPPFEFVELRKHLVSLGTDQLADMIWHRAQADELLTKIAMITVSLRLAHHNWEGAKAAIDYALHFPDYVRYNEHGHGQILDEIKNSLESLAGQGYCEFALHVGQYAIERGQKVAENFEDDSEWRYSLESLTEWTQKLKE